MTITPVEKGSKLSLSTARILLMVFVAQAASVQAQQRVTTAPEWETAAGGRSEFDVASVKPSQPMTPFSTNTGNLDGLDRPAPTGSLFAANAPLMAYLLFAFKITDSIQGRGIYDHLPDWAKSQFFSIEARAAGIPTRDQLRLMVQSLLEERFRLATHREMQTSSVYALAMVNPRKPGPQLQPHPPGEPCVSKPGGAVRIEAPESLKAAPRYSAP